MTGRPRGVFWQALGAAILLAGIGVVIDLIVLRGMEGEGARRIALRGVPAPILAKPGRVGVAAGGRAGNQ